MRMRRHRGNCPHAHRAAAHCSDSHFSSLYCFCSLCSSPLCCRAVYSMLMMCASFGLIIAEVAADGLLVVYSRAEAQRHRGRLQLLAMQIRCTSPPSWLHRFDTVCTPVPRTFCLAYCQVSVVQVSVVFQVCWLYEQYTGGGLSYEFDRVQWRLARGCAILQCSDGHHSNPRRLSLGPRPLALCFMLTVF